MKKIKLTFLLLGLSLSVLAQTQSCLDTVRLKGFYVLKMSTFDFDNPGGTVKTKKREKVKVYSIPIDISTITSFIPMDSITKMRTLSYWLCQIGEMQTYFFDFKTRPSMIKYFNAGCYEENKALIKSDSFKLEISKEANFYKVKNYQDSEHFVFKVCYMETTWLRVGVENKNINKRFISSRLVKVGVEPNAKFFTLFLCLDAKQLDFDIGKLDSNLEIRIQPKH